MIKDKQVDMLYKEKPDNFEVKINVVGCYIEVVENDIKKIFITLEK